VRKAGKRKEGQSQPRLQTNMLNTRARTFRQTRTHTHTHTHTHLGQAGRWEAGAGPAAAAEAAAAAHQLQEVVVEEEEQTREEEVVVVVLMPTAEAAVVQLRERNGKSERLKARK
jgi:hypothetical protein